MLIRQMALIFALSRFKLSFYFLHNLLIMKKWRSIMDKLGLLIVVFCEILEGCHHMIDFSDHLMKIVDFLQV